MDTTFRQTSVKQYVRLGLTVSIALGIMLAPPIYSGLLSLSNITLYPNGTLIMTQVPEMEFPDDWSYTFIDDSTITLSVIFLDGGSISWLNTAVSELQRAEISLSITNIQHINGSASSYYDWQLESMAQVSNAQYGSQICVIFANLDGMQDSNYADLGGYARVQKHTAVVLTPILMENFGQGGIEAIALHEITHCLGFGHTTASGDVMRARYDGTNNAFTRTTVEDLFKMHHAA
jgi:hypothetical protein